MSDSLRDRIAAALMTANSTDAERYELADAVIAALGLRPEHSYGTTYPNVPVEDRRLVRWVTEWAVDDNTLREATH